MCQKSKDYLRFPVYLIPIELEDWWLCVCEMITWYLTGRCYDYFISNPIILVSWNLLDMYIRARKELL